MYKHYKLREFIASIASCFVHTKTGRRRIRDRIRFHGMIKTVGQNHLPLKRPAKNINVAFCTDGGGVKLCAVAIKSLIMASENRCDYDIYCVVDHSVTTAQRNLLKKYVENTKSTITFLTANHDFDNAKRRSWPVSIWYRMMLPELLPNVDKIIYADIDVIFCRDMIEIANIDMGTNILAGVVDYKNGYLNSGFLVMNLKQIRKEGLYQKWVDASKRKDYRNPDQDLLNYSTRGRKLFLPLRYNFQPMRGKWTFRSHSEIEIDDLAHNLAVIHYSNWMKPWSEKKLRPVFSEYWWRVARETGLF